MILEESSVIQNCVAQSVLRSGLCRQFLHVSDCRFPYARMTRSVLGVFDIVDLDIDFSPRRSKPQRAFPRLRRRFVFLFGLCAMGVEASFE